VTSTRKRFANRLNALRSTGPKTSAGRARSARNALRHGLAAGLSLDGRYPAQVEALARTIGGENASPARYQLACAIAAAQVDLMQVRRARDDFLGDAAQERKPTWAFAEIMARIEPLDTYEQSALARRRVAIREFEVMRHPGAQEEEITSGFCKTKPTGKRGMISMVRTGAAKAWLKIGEIGDRLSSRPDES
jgi:hypothetical protein